MRNRIIVLFIICSICFQGCTPKKTDNKIYLENTSVFTTCNERDSSFFYRFYSQKKSNAYTISAKTTDPNITADISIPFESTNNVHEMEVTLHTPPGEHLFDIIITINNKKCIIKDVHHINFNHPDAPDILGQHHGKGEFPSPRSFPKDYDYKVNFTQDIGSYDFKVYGEGLKSLKKISEKAIKVKTKVKKSNISSMTYKVNGEEYSLYNIYHVVSSDYYQKKIEK